MDLNPITTVRDVVLRDYRTVAVFRRHGLDFCSAGGATIEVACREKGVSTGRLLAELNGILNAGDPEDATVSTWEADFLAEYIVQRHHRYVRSMFPLILEHALHAARRYRDVAPEMMEIAKICTLVLNDLEEHMAAEEHVLFPYIKALARAARNEEPFPAEPLDTLASRIRKFEQEHAEGEYWMGRVRVLSMDYTAVIDGCLTCHVLFQELEEFERDMRRHIRLERNILFPKALALEARAFGGLKMLP